MIQIYRPFLIIIAIGLVLAVGSHFGLVTPFTNRLTGALEPVLASEIVITKKGMTLFSIITSIRDLYKENNELRRKNVELEAKLSERQEVGHENEILRNELNFVQETKGEYLPAQLIGRTTAGIIKDLIVNRGTRDGVQVGQAAVAQGFLVGRVESVTDGQATVRLLTHPRSMTPVLGQDSRSSGILKGGISGLTVTDLLIDAPIKTEETVVTSGLGGELPVGIPVGRVIEVIERKGDITKKATVRSPLDVAKLEMIFLRKVQ